MRNPRKGHDVFHPSLLDHFERNVERRGQRREVHPVDTVQGGRQRFGIAEIAGHGLHAVG
jgi:hypothetical protein